jgi:hypothetical protein
VLAAVLKRNGAIALTLLTLLARRTLFELSSVSFSIADLQWVERFVLDLI